MADLQIPSTSTSGIVKGSNGSDVKSSLELKKFDVTSDFSSKNAVPQSKPATKIFLEVERGFIEFPSEDFNQSDLHDPSQRKRNHPIHFAIDIERAFHTCSTLFHGLLAGIGLWQFALVYHLSGAFLEEKEFVKYYGSFSSAVETVFYFFCAICTISVFDRFDIANLKVREVKQVLMSCQKIFIALPYPAALLITLMMKGTSEQFYLYHSNSSLWNSTINEVFSEELSYWKIMNSVRCLLACLGWIIVSLCINRNSLLVALQKIAKQAT